MTSRWTADALTAKQRAMVERGLGKTPAGASAGRICPPAAEVAPVEAKGRGPATGPRFKQFRLIWREPGEKKWRRTAHVIAEPFAQETLERARTGRSVGLTAPIVIPPQIDHTKVEFGLWEEEQPE